MTLHYLNPDDEPRRCEICSGSGYPGWLNPEGPALVACPRCNGTGRLRHEGAKPEIEVRGFGVNSDQWRWTRLGREHKKWSTRIGLTKSEALAAAREALR